MRGRTSIGRHFSCGQARHASRMVSRGGLAMQPSWRCRSCRLRRQKRLQRQRKRLRHHWSSFQRQVRLASPLARRVLLFDSARSFRVTTRGNNCLLALAFQDPARDVMSKEWLNLLKPAGFVVDAAAAWQPPVRVPLVLQDVREGRAEYIGFARPGLQLSTSLWIRPWSVRGPRPRPSSSSGALQEGD